MSADPHRPLREDVRLLGTLLGDTIREQADLEAFALVERVRALAKSARAGAGSDFDDLVSLLRGLPVDDSLGLARAFAHFLNLANIAEQHHRTRRRRDYLRDATAPPQRASFDDAFAGVLAGGTSPEDLHATVCGLRIELVLTAHPTEVIRRTMMRKFQRVADLLAARDRPDLTAPEREDLEEALAREVLAAWKTDELRRERPTPVDEARWGFVVVEQTLWHAVPRLLRRLDRALRRATGRGLPAEAAPIRFASWMGGDRDGNPNVTPEVTERVVRLARWMAADLLHREVDALRSELSMVRGSEELEARAGSDHEPYRALLRDARDRLARTRRRLEDRLAGRSPEGEPGYADAEALAEVLRLCDRSLRACGDGRVADGRLTDLRRQLAAFGLGLVSLDLRQESSRHAAAIDAVARATGEEAWGARDEEARVGWLASRLSADPRASGLADALERAERDAAGAAADGTGAEDAAAVADVLATFRMASRLPAGALGAYVISMARRPSDVLSVLTLQHACGVSPPLRVAPLFETVADLREAGDTMDRLLSVPEYRSRIDDRQEV
ncbi:MAG TPA: phosphoenolpyruvate carboxylase, partial [bacterium]|nr:phosphoenolpyruvate carboxylase [bacterium]